MIKLNNVLLVSAFLLTLTACGGGSSGGISEEVKKESIAKISNYASNSGVEPSKQDYINAGVDSEELKFVDIDELNDLVETKESTEVDSEAELNVLAHSVMDTTAPVITLNGSSTISIALNDTYKEKGATATDKGQSVKVTFISDVNEARIGTYKVVYTAVDKVGNKAIKERTVRVVEDAVPVITLSDTSIKERDDLKTIVTAYDNEDGNIDVVVSGDTNTSVTGIHHIVYTAKDSANHTVTKEVNIDVIPYSVHELIEKGKNGELDDVSYHVIGDSTRNLPNKKLTILVDSYYQSKLTSNISFSHTAMSGQRVEWWLDNRKEGNRYIKKETFKILNNRSIVKNPQHCIVEFSMGINDFIHKEHYLTKEELKEKIKQSVNELQAKNVHVLLVSPVPYYENDNYKKETSVVLNNIYEELKNEPNVSFVSGYNIMVDGYPSNTIDKLHPNKEGLKKLADGIFAHIENDNL